MIDRGHDLPITRQAQLLGMSRRAVYYLARPASAADLALMRRIDELHLEHPFMGARMLRRQLQRQGVAIGRRHVATLMLRMAISGGDIRITTQLRLPDGSNLRLGGKTVERFRFGSPAGFNLIQAAAPDGVSGCST